MTPKSKERATNYVSNVLNPKSIFIEDTLEVNIAISQDKEFYQVSKFMMVTMKLVGNVIVCDDKSSVGIINPNTMEKMHSIPNPTEGCYLYSAFKNEQTKTLYLAYDNKQMIGYDTDNYTKKQYTVYPNCVLQITEFHADPQNYLILSCEKGLI